MARPAHVPPLADALASLEAFLGDPRDPAAPYSHARAVDLDERGEYPHLAVSLLREWGLQEWYVPASLAGRAVDVEDGGNLIRLVARRDITAATAMSINAIAYTALWAGGDEHQRATYAERLRCGSRFAWALSERDHGSDLIANETRAVRTGSGWRLDGEKWLIGNATLSDVVVVLARTSEKSGPAAHSLFVVDRRRCAAGEVLDLPNNPPTGLRGFDLSGLRFAGCEVPDEALVGGVGRGLEIVLKASQMARTNLNFLALGALDTGLRLTLDFVREREIFGSTVWEVPYSRAQLVDSFADLLAMDALVTGAVRALQCAPDQVSSWSSIAKYLVPTVVDEAMTRTSVVLGARHYLRTGPWAIFQKMARDLVVADFADGNTVVNLKNVVAQLPTVLRGLTEPDVVDDLQRRAAGERVARIFGLEPDLPTFEPSAHALMMRRPDDVLIVLPATVAALEERGGDWRRVADLGRGVLARVESLGEEVRRLKEVHGRDFSQAAATFAAAKEYCHLVAAASYLHLQLHGAAALHDCLASPRVTALVVGRLLRRAGPGADAGSTYDDQLADVEALARAMELLHDRGALFAHRVVPLGTPQEGAA